LNDWGVGVSKDKLNRYCTRYWIIEKTILVPKFNRHQHFFFAQYCVHESFFYWSQLYHAFNT